MKFVTIFILGLCLSHNGLHAQKETNAPTAQISSRKTIEYPSASASIMKSQNSWWILGDDASKLLSIDPEVGFRYIDIPYQRPIIKEDKNKGKDARTIKKAKLDWECFASYRDSINEHIWAFGSGSKVNKRDSGIYWLNDEVHKISLHKFYEHLRMSLYLNEKSWNIEGAACTDKTLFLLNRNPSLLIAIPLEEWMRFLQIGELPKTVEYTTITLPHINRYRAGLSGATYDKNRQSLFFTASVEVTNDPIKDGEILGSFIGEIKLTDPAKFNWIARLNDHTGDPIITKLESICIPPQKDHSDSMLFHCTADNDDGRSDIMRVQVNFSPDKGK
ncbi:hypothetical protein N9Y33_01535 [Bacteroidia bacterium]|nr:hypothetical protein [Bacteroidia bacterium]